MQRVIHWTLTISVFFLLLSGYLHPITALTQDLGRHLLTGQIIFQTHAVPKTNLFSYTYPDFPFINHHWLSEVMFFLIHQAFGFVGLELIGAALVSIEFWLVFHFARKRSSFLVLIFLSILYLRILFERTDIRPELFSFLFLALFVTILYSYREKFTKLIFLLIPLALLWVNMHIYFFVGITVLCLFLLDELIVHHKNLRNTHTFILGGVTLASLVVTLLNPNGLSGALYPLHVFQNYGYTIEENQTIFLLERLGFTKPSFPYLKIAIFLLFLSLALAYKKTKPIDWLLGITFTYASVMAVRNLPLFVFATIIPASTSMSSVVWQLFAEKKRVNRFTPVFPALLLLFSIWQIIVTTNHMPLGIGVAAGAERGVDFYQSQNLRGPIFNNFDIGSYLIYRLYPKETVFIDGRPEAYPADFIQHTYIPMQENPPVFATVDTHYHFNTIFFSHTDQTPWAASFLKTIIRNPKWKVVYLDDTVIILVKNIPGNAAIIHSSGMDLSHLQITNLKKTDLNSLLRLASFFDKVALPDQELAMFQKILALTPQYCPALYNSAVLLQRKNDPTAASYIARYQASCHSVPVQ